MANWNPKKQMFAIAGGAVAICLLAAGGVYYTYGLIDEVETSIAAKHEQIQAAEAKIAKIPAVEKEVIILRENLDAYVQILPDTNKLTDFVRTLQQFERQSGILGTVLKPMPRNTKNTGRFAPIGYTYEMTATLWQFLKFTSLIENYERFVAITDFDISGGVDAGGGKGDETRDGDPVHKIRLSMLTYTYNGKSGGKETPIPDYDDKRQALHEEIWNRMQAIKIEKYEHRGHQGRRDIFIDPRERGDLRIDGPSPAEQRTVLDRFVSEITRLREMQQRMKKADTTLFEQYSLEKGLREGLEKVAGEAELAAARVTYAPYRLRWAKEVVAPIEELRGQVDQAAKAEARRPDPYLPMPELEQLVASMAEELKAGQLEDAKNRYESVGQRLAVPADDPRHELAVAAKALHTKAATAIDFKGMDIKVQGVVVNRSGRSGVLLNGEVYEEGDYVADDLLVKMVEEEQVWFVFRGLTLVRTM